MDDGNFDVILGEGSRKEVADMIREPLTWMVGIQVGERLACLLGRI